MTRKSIMIEISHIISFSSVRNNRICHTLSILPHSDRVRRISEQQAEVTDMQMWTIMGLTVCYIWIWLIMTHLSNYNLPINIMNFTTFQKKIQDTTVKKVWWLYEFLCFWKKRSPRLLYLNKNTEKSCNIVKYFLQFKRTVFYLYIF